MRVLFNNTLAIDRAQPEDGGNYVCRGSNGYSEAQDSVDIVVEDLQVMREPLIRQFIYGNTSQVAGQGSFQDNIYIGYNDMTATKKE